MKDIANTLETWLNQNHSIALATVVSTKGSSPRKPGAVMAVNDAGEVTGSVSGGCVEGAIVEEALTVIKDGKPRLLTYGVTDELGFSIGLTCGGSIQVFVERLNQHCSQNNVLLSDIFTAVRKTSTIALALCTLVEGKQAGAKLIVTEDGFSFGSFDDLELDQVVIEDAREMLSHGWTGVRHYGSLGRDQQTDIAVFIETFAPPPRLIIFGAIDFTRALCQLGKMLGYRVTVCDARSRFATATRFPEADEIVVEWPKQYLGSTQTDHRTVIVVLTHDPKFDIPALMTAVRIPSSYIGAMGSRKTQNDRAYRLRTAGLSDADLAQINAPIGLDIGAQTPEETAVSIMAEVIALRNGRSGCQLSQNQNPIHVR